MISVLAFCVLLCLASGEKTSTTEDQEASSTVGLMFHPHHGLLAHHRFKKHLQALYPLGYAFGLGLGHHGNYGHFGNYGPGGYGFPGNYGAHGFHGGIGHYGGIGGYGFRYHPRIGYPDYNYYGYPQDYKY